VAIAQSPGARAAGLVLGRLGAQLIIGISDGPAGVPVDGFATRISAGAALPPHDHRRTKTTPCGHRTKQ